MRLAAYRAQSQLGGACIDTVRKQLRRAGSDRGVDHQGARTHNACADQRTFYCNDPVERYIKGGK
jgi:hypothetical protein